MNSQARGPDGIWYLLPILLMLVAAVQLPVAIWHSVAARADVAVQFKAPGSAEVAIPRPGFYTLWLETKTVYQGTTYESSANLPPGMKFDLVDEDTKSASVPFVPQSGTATMSSGSVVRVSAGGFEVVTPGKYRLSVSGQFPDKIFYFRESYFRQFRGVVRSVAMMLAGWVLAGALALFIFLRRRAALAL